MTTNKFKPGDKVVCVNIGPWKTTLILHKEYTVKSHDKPNNVTIKELEDNGGFFPSRFVLSSVYNYRKDFDSLIEEK